MTKHLVVSYKSITFVPETMRETLQRPMATNRKYEIGCCGSGWGVWNAEGRKIKGFGSRQTDRFRALKYMYMLYGWNWNHSKYVRENPSLAYLTID